MGEVCTLVLFISMGGSEGCGSIVSMGGVFTPTVFSASLKELLYVPDLKKCQSS